MGRAIVRALLTPLLLALAGGCAASRNPFYRDDQVVSERLLVGSWFDAADPKGAAYEVRSADRPGRYLIDGANPDGSNENASLELVLFRLGDHYFLDALPAGGAKAEHRLALVGFNGQKVVIVALERRPLEDRLRGDPRAPAFEAPRASSEELLLTDTTENLQRFLLRDLEGVMAPAEGKENFAALRTSARGLPVDEGPTMAGREQRTLLYWWLVGEALRAPLPPRSSRREIKDAAARFAGFVSGLSELAVDTEAVKAGKELVAFYNAVTDSLNEDDGPRSETLSAVHGANPADVRGALADDLYRRRLIKGDAKTIRERLAAAAGTLNRRYKVRFGEMVF